MIHAQTNGVGHHASHVNDIEHQFNLARTIVIVALGLFAGAVLGGVAGLFVYANSRNPSAHDGFFVLIQAMGVIVGVALGYLAAKGVETQEQIIEASARAGVSLLVAAQAAAAIDGRAFATPDDVKDVAAFVVPHRLIVAPQAEIDGVRAGAIVAEILQTVPVPRDVA